MIKSSTEFPHIIQIKFYFPFMEPLNIVIERALTPSDLYIFQSYGIKYDIFRRKTDMLIRDLTKQAIEEFLENQNIAYSYFKPSIYTPGTTNLLQLE